MKLETAGLLAAGAMLVSGVLSAMQPPTNAMVIRASGSPLNAALVSFVVGTIGLAVVCAALRARPDLNAAVQAPWYAWIGGLYGAVFVASAAFATPRLGVAATLALLIAGQAVGGLAIDHWGAFNVPRNPVTGMRLAGMALVAVGVLLVRSG